MEHEPPHYQDKLAEVIQRERPKIVVESGCESGFGAEFLLKALEANGVGHLYSFDPSPHGMMISNPIKHKQFTLLKDFSYNLMVPFFMEHGPYDMFLHDSDHGPGCQTFEYELAWNLTKRGGIIATDDPMWGIGPSSVPHRSWDLFLARRGLTEMNVSIGNACYFKKPEWGPEPKRDEKWAKECWKQAAIQANAANALSSLSSYLIIE